MCQAGLNLVNHTAESGENVPAAALCFACTTLSDSHVAL